MESRCSLASPHYNTGHHIISVENLLCSRHENFFFFVLIYCSVQVHGDVSIYFSFLLLIMLRGHAHSSCRPGTPSPSAIQTDGPIKYQSKPWFRYIAMGRSWGLVLWAILFSYFFFINNILMKNMQGNLLKQTDLRKAQNTGTAGVTSARHIHCHYVPCCQS